MKKQPKKLYICECHGSSATKPALEAVPKGESQTNGLGKWRCGETNKRTKVTPQAN